MLNSTRPAQLTLTDELRILYWRQVVRLTRWLKHQAPRLNVVRQYSRFIFMAWLFGLLIGLLARIVL